MSHPKSSSGRVLLILACACMFWAPAGARDGAPEAPDGRTREARPLPATPVPEAFAPATIRSLDHFLRGQSAWKRGERETADAEWTTAATLDPQSLPPRLALARSQLAGNPRAAASALREATDIFWTDFRAQRWLIANGVLAFVLAAAFGVLLVAAGLFARHIRAVHHVLAETVAWSLRPGRSAPWIAGALLALPLLAGAGVLCTALFWVFLCAFRFERSERMAALAIAAFVIVLGPALMAGRLLWAEPRDGRDAILLYEAQREPASIPSAAAGAHWSSIEPGAAVPRFLEGLAALEADRSRKAGREDGAASAAGGIPPAVLETNLGTAALLAGSPHAAEEHYLRALAFDPKSFEAHYNLGILYAGSARYVEADSAMERAACIDLDRLRRLGRGASDRGPRPPLPALCSNTDLWTWTVRHPAAPVPPALLAALLPCGSLLAAVPVALLAIILGLAAGGRLRRLLQVRSCAQCGAEVCRRCQTRIDRRVYCRSCAQALGGLNLVETTRVLIRRLLEDRSGGSRRAVQIASWFVPGAGAAARGAPFFGAVAGALAGLAAACVLFPLWGRPFLPIAGDEAVPAFLRICALLPAFGAFCVNAAGIRAGERRRASLRAFLAQEAGPDRGLRAA